MFNQWRIRQVSGGGWLVLAVVAAVAAGGGWAVAATSNSSGVIHACAAKHGGSLRLAQHCRKKERAVSWNVRGIPGQNGTNGTNGANGTPGSARAYARVLPSATTPTFDPARTKNFVAVDKGTSGLAGVYCLTPAAGIDPATTPFFVSADWVNTPATGDSVAYYHPGGNCPASKFEVITANEGTRVDTIGFTVMVP